MECVVEFAQIAQMLTCINNCLCWLQLLQKVPNVLAAQDSSADILGLAIWGQCICRDL